MENSKNFDLILKFERFIGKLKKDLHKCKFRKCLQEVILHENSYRNLTDFWKIQDMKIKMMLKIIDKKLFKPSTPVNFKSIEEWLLRVEDEIKIFQKMLDESDDECLKKRFIIHNLDYILLMSTFQLHNQNLFESIGYLSMADKIIQKSINVYHDLEIINLSQKIYLLIISTLIADNDFETAKYYIDKSSNFCLRELHFRKNSNDKSKMDERALNKVYFNLALIFYQNGVCNENLGNVYNALHSYKAAKWLSSKYLIKTHPEFVQLITDVVKNSMIIHKCLVSFEKDQKKIEEENVVVFKGKNKNNDDKHHIEQIQRLNFTHFEIESTKESENIKEILSTHKLVSSVLSYKFKDVIEKLENLSLHKVEKKEQEIIQKKLNEIRREQNYKKLFEIDTIDMSSKSLFTPCLRRVSEYQVTHQKTNYEIPKKKFSQYLSIKNNSANFIKFKNPFQEESLIKKTSSYQTNKSKEDDRKTNSFGFSEILQRTITNSTSKELEFVLPDNAITYLENERVGRNNVANFMSILNLETKTKTDSKIHSFKNLNQTKKIQYDSSVFSTSFRKKIDHFKKVYNKELNFQKKILRLKKNENFPNLSDFDLQKTSKEQKESLIRKIHHFSTKEEVSFVDTKVKNNKNNILKNSLKQELNSYLNIGENQEKKKKIKLENVLIKSLDSKKYGELESMMKNSYKKFQLRKEFLTEKEEDFEKSLSFINNNNEMISSRLENELRYLENLQVKKKEIKKISKTKKRSILKKMMKYE